MFTNAKTVMINNKEVQSIITSNGGVIYKNWKLDLTSDKQVIQTSETATLTATLTHGGTGVSGELIIFETDKPATITTDDNTVSYTMTGDYKITLPENKGGEFISITKYDTTGSIIFAHNISSEKYYIEADQPIYLGSNILYVIGNSLYYTDEDGEFTELDVSDYDTSVIDNPFYNGGVEIETDVLSDVTDANGVASVSYVGKGTGLLNIQAIYNSIFSSEIYSIYDCIVYDPLTTDNHHWTTGENMSAVYSTNGVTVENATSSTRHFTSDYLGTDNTTIEFDIKTLSLTVSQIRFRFTGVDIYLHNFSEVISGDVTHVKVICTGGVARLYINNVDTTARYNLSSTPTALRWGINNAKIQLKDFKVYSA